MDKKITVISGPSRKAIVMGATSGIGREVALELARKGWQIGIAGRRMDCLKEVMRENGQIVSCARIDVTDPDSVTQLRELIRQTGGMDLYFHSSGIGFQNGELDAEKELSTVETNCLGMARMVGEAFRYFSEHPDRPGQIAVISSIAGTKGLGAAPAYSASKRFTSHYVESLQQLATIRHLRNLYLTDIRPGFVRTPLIEGSGFPMQLEPDKVAQTIVRAVERRQRVVTINWFYRILVFFWRLIPSCWWVRLRIR